MNPRHPVARVARLYESMIGPTADGALCVTRAMSRWLKVHWNVDAAVVHDKAPARFGDPACLARAAAVLRAIDAECADDGGSHPLMRVFDPAGRAATPSRFAEVAEGAEVAGQKGGAAPPFLIVSSTSWTPDEDFSILLDAVAECEALAHQASATARGAREFPRLLVAVTGNGPQRAYYEAQMTALASRLQRTTLATLWLAPDDYPVLLAAADLGASLHTSSSGLDLPMKVVDMMGCGLPVLAVDYDTLGELVVEGVTGRRATRENMGRALYEMVLACVDLRIFSGVLFLDVFAF
jgi:beta-1,4-mannosyltransferase